MLIGIIGISAIYINWLLFFYLALCGREPKRFIGLRVRKTPLLVFICFECFLCFAASYSFTPQDQAIVANGFFWNSMYTITRGIVFASIIGWTNSERIFDSLDYQALIWLLEFISSWIFLKIADYLHGS